MRDEDTRTPLSVALPTYGRDEVLVDTIEYLLAQGRPASEILVVDQTPQHGSRAEAQLSDLHRSGAIRWLRVEQPSQPAALNIALTQASQPIVLFLDDDIRPGEGLLGNHVRHYDDPAVWAVAGQVLQPDQEPLAAHEPKLAGGPLADLDFPFHSAVGAWVRNGMSGNLSVRRAPALEVGGFDENFVAHVAYRFDAEFCKRLCRAGGRIWFDPEARIYHLRAQRGGTRTAGSHLTSASPAHGVGDYYFACRQGLTWPVVRYVLRRPFREVCTRFHLRRPWWIPVKLIGELTALAWALALVLRGPKLVGRDGAGEARGEKGRGVEGGEQGAGAEGRPETED